MADVERGFLGLTHNPFVQPDEGFFEAADRKTHLEQLRHLSQWSRRVLLVTGPSGVGKSALYKQLSATLEPRCKAARIHGSLVNASREVLMGVAQGFGIAAPNDANSQLLKDLVVSHVAEQESADRVCVVMVDDAELLEPRGVVELLTLANECPLQLVLFGEVRLVPAIERAVGRLGMDWHEIRLSGFSEQQSRQYLEWRFKQARYRGRLPFTDQQVKEIHRLSAGLPGRINQMANVLLVKLETGDVGRPRSAFPPLHGALLLLLMVVIGLVYLLWEQNERANEADLIAAVQNTGPDVASSAAEPEPETELLAQAPEIMPEVEVTSIDAPPETVTDPVSTSAEPLPAPGEDDTGGVPAPVDEADVASVGSLQQGRVLREVIEPGPNESASTPLPSPTSLAAPEPGTATTSRSAQNPPRVPVQELDADRTRVQAKQQLARSDPPATPPPTTASAAETSASAAETSASAAETSAPAAEPSATSAGAAATTSNTTVRDGTWLLNQAADRYTLQLLTVSSAERARQFVLSQPDPREFAVYQLQRDGRTLHVVVYGLFTDRAAADSASKTLPASVGNVKPWIRPLEQVHGAIRTVPQ